MCIYKSVKYDAKRHFPPRATWMILIDILTSIPWGDFLHVMVMDLNIFTYYTLRMQYAIRIYRIIYYGIQLRKNVGLNNLFLSLLETSISFSILLILFSCILFYIICDEDSCSNNYITVISYLMYKSSSIGFEIIRDIPQHFLIDMVFINFVLFVCIEFGISMTTSAVMQNMRPQMDFSNEHLAWMTRLNEKFKGNTRKNLIAFLKKFSTIAWSRRKSFTTSFNYNRIIPETMLKEIKLDLCWNALKHSNLFRRYKPNVLRHISTLMNITYWTSGELIYKKDKPIAKMIYLITGVLQLLSPEDGETPILSLSGGSILGEISLFYDHDSPCTVMCQSYCVIAVLERKSFLKFIPYYPNVYKILLNTAKMRFRRARLYKSMLSLHLRHTQWENRTETLAMKWIKTSTRKLLSLKDGEKQQEIKNLKARKEEDMYRKGIYFSWYLDQLVIVEDLELNTQSFLLKTSFPIIFQPDATVFWIWDKFLSILALILSGTYIFYVCGSKKYVDSYGMFFIIISFAWIFDVIFQVCTAIKTRDTVMDKVGEIIMVRIESFKFWIDVLAALPLELLAIFMVGPQSVQTIHCLQCNRLLKVYKIYNLFSGDNINEPAKLVRMKHVRYNIFWIIIIINVSGILYLLACDAYSCETKFENFLINVTTNLSLENLRFLICLYLAVCIISGINFEYVPILHVHIFLIIQFLRLLLFIYHKAELTSAEALKDRRFHNYQEYKTNLQTVTRIWKIDENLRKDMMYYIDDYYRDGSNFNLLNGQEIITYPQDVFKIARHRMYEHLEKIIPIFRHLPNDIMTSFSTQIARNILQPGQVIIYAGEICKAFYFIEIGSCEIIYPGGAITKILGPGDSFCALDACLRIPSLLTAITLTHCRIHSLTFDNYLNSFRNHPNLLAKTKEIIASFEGEKISYNFDSYEIPTKIKHVWKKPDSFKLFGYKISADSPEARDYFDIFDGYHLLKYLKYILLRYTVHCNGSFCHYWEISRCIFALFSGFLNPITSICTSSNSFWMFVLMFLDATVWVDIYMRHHVSYFDEKNIEITHPLMTAFHYWQYGFLIDVLGVFPLHIVIPIMLQMNSNSTVITFLRMNRLLQFYRFYVLISVHIKEKTSKFWNIVKYYTATLFFLNILTSVFVFTKCDFGDHILATDEFEAGVACYDYTVLYPQPTGSFSTPYSGFKVHVLGLYFVTSAFVGTPVEGFEIKSGDEYVQVIVIGFCGMAMITFMSARIIASYLLRNVDLINYQSAMHSLVTFMSYRKIDIKLRNEIIDHFEYIWHKKQGINEQDIFQIFNVALQEDIFYNIYGTILHENSVFKHPSKSFFKSLLLYVKHRVYLNMGIISRVNDVHKLIFIVLKGKVEVLGPDYSHLLVLSVGAMFGTLDNCYRMRQTLTMVAKGHVEVLVIDSLLFHSILSRYSEERKQFELLTAIHVDYLVGKTQTDNIVVTAKKASVFNIIKKRKRVCKCYVPSFLKTVYTGRVIKIWETFILSVVCYIGFIFELYQKNSRDNSIYLLGILYFSDLLFIIKIYLKFHTGYLDEFGLMVTKLNMISKQYLWDPFGFLVDISSTVPFEIIAVFFKNKDNIGTVITFGRMNRLIRVVHVIRYFHSVNRKLHINVFVMRTLYLFCWIILIMQLLLNIFFFIALTDESLEVYNSYRTTNYKIIIYLKQLVILIHMAIGTKLNNFLPNSPYVIVTQVMMVVLIKFLIIVSCSTMCATMEIVTHNKTDYELQIKEIRNNMQFEDVSKPLQERIWTYLTSLWRHKKGIQFPQLLVEAPYYLKEGLLNSMYGYHLRRHPILKKCHVDLIRQMSAYMRTRIFLSGDYLTFFGDIDECMYFIEEGTVLELMEETLSGQKVKRILNSGEMFGFEQGILPRVGHVGTYKAFTYCVIIILPKKCWIYLLDFFPASKHVIYNT